MTQQNINFLDPLQGTRREKYQISIQRFLWLNIFFNIALLLMLTGSFYHLYQLMQDTSRLSTELAIKERALLQLKAYFPKKFFENQPGEATTKIHQDVVISKKILDSLKSRISFSDLLLCLSNDIVPQVWLTKINFSNESDDIIFNGKSYSEKQLEKFISNLARDKQFSGYVVNLNRIERISEKNETVVTEFEVKLSEKS
jgi:hypothetical protein